ncbi:unnamed protein product [Mytilus edulis]|uniref:Uncharacterized protein n=1 Tax=Mytilus edulis TaxID=6550 RepID=A0A8S3TMP7_MYTED|nr:unnamed protein product [Mytilus edulis]
MISNHDWIKGTSWIRYKDRVVINHKKTRDLVQKFSKGEEIQNFEFSEIITGLKKTFAPALPLFEMLKSLGCCQVCPIEHRLIMNLISSSSPASLKKIRTRGNFKADRSKVLKDECKKEATRHPTLLPGIFTAFCKHGICYGFQIMECNESPNVPFTFLRTRFKKAPTTVIYDNACNLHSYCLNRDPDFFKDTLFVVDNLHWGNHTSCSRVYEAKFHPELSKVNTQMVEQNNAKLRKLKSNLSYMNYDNFMSHLKFFLWYCNMEHMLFKI